MLDAPSKTILEQVIENANYSFKNKRIRFELFGQIPDSRKDYAINVHIDRDSNGKINRGDFINMESYLVLTYGRPDKLLVHVKEVK